MATSRSSQTNHDEPDGRGMGAAQPPYRADRIEQARDAGDGDLSDLLSELRILLPGAQMLVAFLIILPFNSGFSQIQRGEKLIYLATFLCSVCSLILFAAPAAQHRLQRPLRDRVRFKETATRLIVVGLVPLSLAIILATHLVIAQVLAERWVAWTAAAVVTVLIAGIWWLGPLVGRAARAGPAWSTRSNPRKRVHGRGDRP
jgi:hypothetical protein